MSDPRWIIQPCDGDYSLAVGALWPDGVRHAVSIMKPPKDREAQEVEGMKQTLREWYRQKHG